MECWDLCTGSLDNVTAEVVWAAGGILTEIKEVVDTLEPDYDLAAKTSVRGLHFPLVWYATLSAVRHLVLRLNQFLVSRNLSCVRCDSLCGFSWQKLTVVSKFVTDMSTTIDTVHDTTQQASDKFISTMNAALDSMTSPVESTTKSNTMHEGVPVWASSLATAGAVCAFPLCYSLPLSHRFTPSPTIVPSTYMLRRFLVSRSSLVS